MKQNKTKGTFTLSLYDRKGQKLNMGDIVKVSIRGQFEFYSEVKYLEDEQAIAPFHTFSFHSFEKVDKVPKNAKESTEQRYRIWYLEDPEKDKNEEQFGQYLMSWCTCEHELKDRCFRIELAI